MARYKEDYKGFPFDIQVNTESGLIRILADGIEGKTTFNKATGIPGKGEFTFSSLDQMQVMGGLMIELFKKVAAERLKD